MTTASQIDAAMRNFAIDVAFGDQAQRIRSGDALRDLIAAALADAERKGAEAMREAAASAVNSAVFPGLEIEEDDVTDAIRALPLPTGSQS